MANESSGYLVIAKFLGDFSKDRNDVLEGRFGPLLNQSMAEQVVVALASQPAQDFWAVVSAEIVCVR